MSKEVPTIDSEQVIELVNSNQANNEAKIKSKKNLAANRLAKRIVKKLDKKGQTDIRVKAGKFGIFSTPQDEDVYLEAGKKITDAGTNIEFVVHREAGYDSPVIDTVKVLKVDGEEVQEDMSDQQKKDFAIKTKAVYPPEDIETDAKTE